MCPPLRMTCSLLPCALPAHPAHRAVNTAARPGPRHDHCTHLHAPRPPQVMKHALALRPVAVVVDSIQTMYLPELPNPMGSVVQVGRVPVPERFSAVHEQC